MPAANGPCVVRSFQIYEWVRSGKPQMQQGGSLSSDLVSIRKVLVKKDLILVFGMNILGRSNNQVSGISSDTEPKISMLCS